MRLLFLRHGEDLLVGYAVGKRQGKAHVRNRGRRVLREAFRRLLPWVTPGVSLVFSLKDRALNASAVDVYHDMARLMERKGLLAENWEGPDWSSPAPPTLPRAAWENAHGRP